MVDALTSSVLDCQAGKVPLDSVRNDILLEAFTHFRRYRRRKEDEVSEFLLELHAKIPGMIERFRYQGLPFRHFLLRSVRWQWSTFLALKSRQEREDVLACEYVQGEWDTENSGETIDESASLELSETLTSAHRKRLVLLALKAAPDLDPSHWEHISAQTGADLAWLQGCQERLREVTHRRRSRKAVLVEKRGEFYLRRIMAEEQARRELDPERRRVCESRAGLYRSRLANLHRQQAAISEAPTHRELAKLLEMPKGSIDSGLYHLKRSWSVRYSGPHENSSRLEQRPQTEGI